MRDAIIPREHRAHLVVTCDTDWRVVEDLPRLVAPMKYSANFQEQRQHGMQDNADYVFELA
jgi:hypothetical protein